MGSEAARQRRYRQRQRRREKVFSVPVTLRTRERLIDAGRVSPDASDEEIALELAGLIEERVSLLANK